MKHHPYIVHMPRDTGLAAIRQALGVETNVLVQPPVSGRRQWLDSHDWRVHTTGQMLERWGSTDSMRLRLTRYDEPADVLELPSGEQPTGASSFSSAVLRRRLAGTLGVRSLAPRCEVRGTVQVLGIVDRREKIIVRAEVWRPRRRGDLFVRVTPLRGYAAAALRVAKRLRRCAGAQRDVEDPLLIAAAKLDITPGNYPSWQRPDLLSGPDSEMRTDDALMGLLAHYARVMELNMSGMSAAVDSEFLHQFRIGVRRSRALLSHTPGTLANARVRHIGEYLAWLGAQTSPVRDADVHSLVFPNYVANLKPSARDALTPMMVWLDDERQRAQSALAVTLASHRFGTRWQAWMRFVNTPAPRLSRQPAALQPLASVAPEFIAACARRVVRKGRRIDQTSPPHALHNLRKACKNLRYMIDAYGVVIPGNSLKKAVSRLKGLQSLLGEYQDLDVHQGVLCDLQQRMAHDGVMDADAQQAMELLQKSLSARAQSVRARFPASFAAFREIRLARSLRSER